MRIERLFVILTMCAFPMHAVAESKEWAVSPSFGYSGFSGVLGIEGQYRHFALAVGLPNHVGAKYYLHPYRNSWFTGPHFQWSLRQTERTTLDGVEYEGRLRTAVGWGLGYRFGWSIGDAPPKYFWQDALSRLHTEVGVSVSRVASRWEKPGLTRNSKDFLVMPIATIGYLF